MSDLTHFDADGNARMVDVSAKSETLRLASASGEITMAVETGQRIRQGQIEKGDVLAVARLAGIMAAKRTDQMIPLCHSLGIQSVEIEFRFVQPDRLAATAIVKTFGRTGVEMEALHAVSVALLTVYDMCKAIDRGMMIQNLGLTRKEGGKSGTWIRS